jgi:hypothetical protein
MEKLNLISHAKEIKIPNLRCINLVNEKSLMLSLGVVSS